MPRYVILLTDAQDTPDAALLDALCAAGVAAFVEGLRDVQESSSSSRGDSAVSVSNDELPSPLAVLYEIRSDAEIEEIHAAITQANTIWKGIPLVACRRQCDPFLASHLRLVESTTLRRLGFTSVADDPAQLPAIFRELEEHGTGFYSRPIVNLMDAMLPGTLLLPQHLTKEMLRVAFELVASLHFTADQRSSAHAALVGLRSLIRADRWVIYLALEPSSNAPAILEPLAARGQIERESEPIGFNWQHAVFGEVLARPGDESRAAREALTRTASVKKTEKSWRVLAVPLVSNERVIGVIEAVRIRQSTAFTRRESALLDALALPIGSALANSLRIDEAERLSQTDDLTKLHNARYLRHYLLNEVKRARRYGSNVAAIFLDLDDFKKINDEHGHLVGSHVLMEIAAVILNSVRDTDIVARYGGDEFVIVLPESALGQAMFVSDRIRETIEKQVFTGGRRLRLRLTASFGVATFPQHAQSPQQLIATADSAMYEAKAAGKNCSRVVSPVYFAADGGISVSEIPA
jgi:diguanylate cyclase (GGDEF)-like protein